MSSKFYFDYLPKITVNNLFYFFDKLQYRWKYLGKELGISSDKLDKIEDDYELFPYKYARCMIEMFAIWLSLNEDNPDLWHTIIEVVDKVDQKYADKICHYVNRFGKEEKNNPTWWFGQQGSRDYILSQDMLDLLSSLQIHARKWYKLGIALNISKETLDEIEENPLLLNDNEGKLSELLIKALENQSTWQKLVNALCTNGLNGTVSFIETVAKTKCCIPCTPFYSFYPLDKPVPENYTQIEAFTQQTKDGCRELSCRVKELQEDKKEAETILKELKEKEKQLQARAEQIGTANKIVSRHLNSCTQEKKAVEVDVTSVDEQLAKCKTDLETCREKIKLYLQQNTIIELLAIGSGVIKGTSEVLLGNENGIREGVKEYKEFSIKEVLNYIEEIISQVEAISS